MRALVLLSVLALTLAGAGAFALRESEVEPAAAALATVGCEAAVMGGPARGAPAFDPNADAVAGPFVLTGARRTPDLRHGAFGGNGYKIPLTLPANTVATLMVPRALWPDVRLLYTPGVFEVGQSAGSRALRFSACDAAGGRTRTGWAGGIVVDQPRCIVLRVRLAGERDATSHRVPVGRRCG